MSVRPSVPSIDSCCCRATCGPRKFRSDCEEVQHTRTCYTCIETHTSNYCKARANKATAYGDRASILDHSDTHVRMTSKTTDYGWSDDKQVSVKPPPSALNMTLPAFAAERRRVQHGTRSASTGIDRYLLRSGRSAANPPSTVAAVDRYWTDRPRRTDADRYIDPAMRAASERLRTEQLIYAGRVNTDHVVECSQFCSKMSYFFSPKDLAARSKA